MVDRMQRDIASRVIRGFIDGTITNDQFEDEFPRAEHDRALQALRADLWAFYSDLRRHELTGKHQPSADGKAFLERCVLFLETDLEFEWPMPTISLSNIPRNLWHRVRHWFSEEPDQGSISVAAPAGDEQVYPFLRISDYKMAVAARKRSRAALRRAF